VGILAALIAAGIAVGGLLAGQAYALRLAEGDLAQLASAPLPIKFETLTFQRAVYATAGELPVYGSSELFCCGQPDLPTQFFAHAPTGFQVFAIGRAGTGDLLFLETFGALGPALRGKRLVLSVSPQWYYGAGGIGSGYDGNFSPEIAEVFTYDAPLPLALREAAARQMAAHPATLRGQGLLRLGVQALAAGDLPAYYALLPAGRLDAWAQQLKDAWQTIAFIRSGNRTPGPVTRRTTRAPASAVGTSSPAARGSAVGGPRATGTSAPAPGDRRPAAPPASPGAGPSPAAPPGAAVRSRLAALSAQAAGPEAAGPVDWQAKLRAATLLQNTLAGSDPFGFSLNAASLREISPALRLYCAGLSNRDGGVYPYPARWADTMRGSAEWTDLSLELSALRELGARALVWTVPLQGYYDDYTQLSRPARQVYYQRFRQVTAPSGYPAVDFAALDEDRLAMANTGAHFSARGWVLADRVLDLFWQGQTDRIPGALATLTAQVPPPPPEQAPVCAPPGGDAHGAGR
jgi:hypothetical protein